MHIWKLSSCRRREDDRLMCIWGLKMGLEEGKNSEEVSGVLECFLNCFVEVIDHSLCMLSCVPTLL